MSYSGFWFICPKLAQIDTLLKRVRSYHDQYQLDTYVMINAIAQTMIDSHGHETFSSMLDSNPTSCVADHFEDYIETKLYNIDGSESDRKELLCLMMIIEEFYCIEIAMLVTGRYALNCKRCFGSFDSHDIREISKQIEAYYEEYNYEKMAEIVLDDFLFMDELETYIEENKFDIENIKDNNAMTYALEEYHAEEDDYIMYHKNSDLLIKLYINAILGG